jgi:chorismate--pyruvate lyase
VYLKDPKELCYRADAPANWREARQLYDGLPTGLLDWLTDSGSLTARLKQLSDGTFRVKVLSERWVLATAAQRRLLSQQYCSRLMWSRHVQLCVHDRPWVAAHSLIPFSSMKGRLRQLMLLRDRPLGGFLFEQPGLRRRTPELACVNQGWGRRSVFELGVYPLLVAEFFLPVMLDHLGINKHD